MAIQFESGKDPEPIMDNRQAAVESFNNQFNCAQAVFSAYAEQFGLDRDSAIKVAAAFGGGIARSAGVCGAVTGALMVIGLKHGSTDPKDKKAKGRILELSQKLMDRFAQKNGSTVCKTLLHVDISTADGLKAAQKKKLFKTLCPRFVADATEILDQLL